LKAAMRVGGIHHARSIGIAPVPSPTGRHAGGIHFFKAGIGKQVRPALNRLDDYSAQLDRLCA